MSVLSPTQEFILYGLICCAAFLAGMWVSSLHDETELAPPRVEYVEVLSGDFQDVPLIMRNSMGSTFRWTCDMHFTPAPRDEHSAECEHAE